MGEGKWIKKELTSTGLMGKTLGILGMGRIGTALAIRARAFRMNILCWRPLVYFSDFAVIRNHLEEVLAESDYISLHMPLVDSTRGIINKKTLASVKKGAYMINTGRGQCVIEEDIAAALKEGTLAGYASDVCDSDPPENSTLLIPPNVLMSPNIGSRSNANNQPNGENT